VGMALGEITALVIIIDSFRRHFAGREEDFDAAAWWTVTLGLAALSLATPLGHLAGAVKDFGEEFAVFAKHVALLGAGPGEVLDGYIGSHSHQILAAFLAAAFALPLLRKPAERRGVVYLAAKIGLVIMLISTIAQTALYQFCAWSGWEPPDLFTRGPNGVPLDDFVLGVLGLGMLFLLPALLSDPGSGRAAESSPRFVRGMTAVFLLSYMIAIVALGLYIEFNEGFFGHAEENAPGVANGQAYVRAHLIFGFLIIPILLGAFLNGSLLLPGKRKRLSVGTGFFAVLAGLAGTFDWTFNLDSFLLKISLVSTVAFLFFFTAQIPASEERETERVYEEMPSE